VAFFTLLVKLTVGCSDCQHSLYSDDFHDGRLVWSLLRCSVDGNDLSSGLAEVLLLGLLEDEGNKVVGSLVGWDLVALDTAADVELSDDGEGDGAGKDGDHWLVLGDKASHVSSVCEHDDEVDIEIEGGVHCRSSEGLSGADWSWGEHLDVVERSLVVNASLGFGGALAHDGDGVDWVVTSSGLTGEHDAISSIKDGVGDIGCFGTGGTGSLAHGFEHLRSSDDRLGCDVSLFDHPLLGNEDLLGWDLHAEITSCNHDTIGGSENIIIIVESFLVLDLGNDLNVSASWSENITDSLNIFGLSHERGCDHVDALLDTELNKVDLVLLSEGWEVNDCSWKVHVFAFSKTA